MGEASCKFKGSASASLPVLSAQASASGEEAWENKTSSGSWTLGDYSSEYKFMPMLELYSRKPTHKFVLKFRIDKNIDFERAYSSPSRSVSLQVARGPVAPGPAGTLVGADIRVDVVSESPRHQGGTGSHPHIPPTVVHIHQEKRKWLIAR